MEILLKGKQYRLGQTIKDEVAGEDEIRCSSLFSREKLIDEVIKAKVN